MTSSTYLPHLDGLRAIALTGVLLFHFQVPFFYGGFAGVDVFLSLSGFLITRNIARDIAKQNFSLRAFYIRRFYRLYPASVLTVALALTLASLTFPSALAKSTAASGLAAMQFGANIFFHAQANYFDAAAITKPLLHMWSLSLEEQFYFLWAPMIFFTHRFTSGFRPVAAVLFLLFSVSLTLGITLASSMPSFVFYELPARIFQFAAGALVALWEASNSTISKAFDTPWHQSEEEALQYKLLPSNGDDDKLESSASPESESEVSANDVVDKAVESVFLYLGKEVLSVLAVCALCASYVLLPPNATPLQMLPTTISTCLVIMLPGTVLSRYILSNGVLRFIGRISYSAYLVHWPIWVFAVHVMSAVRLGTPNPIMMIAVTALVGTLLQRCVETPFRRGSYKTLLGVISVLTGSAALAGVVTNGFSFRFGDFDFDLSNLHQAGMLFTYCRDETGAQSEMLPGFHVKKCRVGDINGTQGKYAFFGDSFTLHLAGALDGVGKRRKEWYGLHFQSGCRFLPHSSRKHIKPTRFGCPERHDELWRELEALDNGTTVAVANSWGNLNREKTIPSLMKDIKAAGHSAAIVGEPPGIFHQEKGYFDCADFAIMPVSRVWQLIRKGKFEGAKDCKRLSDGLPPFSGRAAQAKLYRTIAQTTESVKLIELFDKLCSQSDGKWRCRVPNLQKVVYDIGYRRDRHHLTRLGSVALSEVYEQAIFGSGNSSSRELSLRDYRSER